MSAESLLLDAAKDIVPPPWRVTDPQAAARQMREVRALARAKNAVILAHNYQLPEIQETADFVGDSESLEQWKERYPDHTVVTYVNSSAEVKALSDICCTSANAISVIRSIPNRRILFTPDRNLGAWVARQVPEKEIVVYDGVCPTHDVLRDASLTRVKSTHPEAVVIAHPECREDVLALADEICSTSGMITAVERHPEASTFIVATEWALLHQLKKRYPGREFLPADGCIGCRLHCPYMKMITLDGVQRALQEEVFEIEVHPDDTAGARLALERMMAVPRDH
jgi:quinolinate synthase